MLEELIIEGYKFGKNPKKDFFDNDAFVNETMKADFLVWTRKVLSYIETEYPNNENGKEIREKLKKDQERCYLETYLLIMSIIKSMKDMENQKEQKPNNNSVLSSILYGFGNFARQLNRRYNNRQGINITDEYDVQDLLHAQLVEFFEDVRAEDPVPICAGRGSRLDFLIADINTAVEVKMTRQGLEDKALGDQILQDLGRYQKHGDIERLVFFIYDPDKRIQNPTGLKDDIEKQSRDNFNISVVIAN